jgi:hypothetical protein
MVLARRGVEPFAENRFAVRDDAPDARVRRGFGLLRELEGLRHEGGFDYVIKPFLPEEVLARGMRLLGITEAGIA